MAARSHLWRLFAALLCAPLFDVALWAAEPSPRMVPREGLLVLTNGRVIEGLIAVEGEYYKVLLPKGKLQVRVDQVEFLCHSKEEAFIRRRARQITMTSTAEAHLDLARWCVQHDLLAYAEAEIAVARRLDPQHRFLPGLERQIAQAKQLAGRSADPLVIDDEQVVVTSTASEHTGRALGEIPPWARTEFIKRIQPMMVQSCATAGCHLPGTGQSLQIDRTAIDGVGSPDLIHRNLAAIIAQVDLAEPDASSLLVRGAAAHGAEGQQSRPLTPHQLEILRAWITQLAINEPPRQDLQSTPQAQIVVGMNHAGQQPSALGTPVAAAAPDPFDPAEFNAAQQPTGERTSNEVTQATEDSTQ